MSYSSNNFSAKGRRYVRTAVTIPIDVIGVLDRFQGEIANLSEGGAMIVGGNLPARARCELRYGDQTVYATVMWAEIDRIGVRFPFELVDGPLFNQLQRARSGGTAFLPLGGSAPVTRPLFGRRGL